MSRVLWDDGDEDVDINSRVADMSKAALANKKIVESKKHEIDVIKKHMDNLVEQHGQLAKKLEKYTDQTGNLNMIRGQIQDTERELSLVRFKDQQVDKIYNRKRLGFVLIILTPIALALSYYLTVGVVFALVFQNTDEWFKKLGVCALLFLLFIFIGIAVYNNTKKLRNKWFKTPIPSVEHAKNQTAIKSIELRLDGFRSRELEYKEKQNIYLQLSARQSDLERKIDALEGKYKEAALVSGEY